MALAKNRKVRTLINHSLAVGTGYLAWLLLYTHLPITQQYTTELSFFNLPETVEIDAPETVTLSLRAPRALLDTVTPIVHIDAQMIPLETPYVYHIDHKNLLVPQPVEMVHCYPPVISVTKHVL
jgi:hypothetical protein